MIVLMVWGLIGAFPHAQHVDSLACQACHTDVWSSEQPQDLLLPDPQSCLQCHDSPKGYTLPESTTVWIDVFSHKLHEGTECLECHGKAQHPVLPKMRVCLQCHDRDEVRSNCWICHAQDDPKFATYHPKKWLQQHPFRAGSQCFQCHWKNRDATDRNPTPGCLPCHNQPH